MKYIKFTGKYKDLKAMGYTFQKLYARNYRCYHKSIAEYSSQTIWIWQKDNRVEIMDLYDLSYLVLQEIVVNGRTGKRYEINSVFPNPDTTGHFMLDIQDKKLLDNVYEIEKMGYNIEDKEEIKAYWQRYRTVNIDDKLTLMIADLYDKGLIEIAEEIS